MSTNSKEISSFRRLFPQVLVTLLKGLIIFTAGIFDGITTLIIPSLLGIATTLNPDETIRITGAEASWLSSISNLGKPFGSFLGGIFTDAFGRRKALMLVMVPTLITSVMLGMAESFWVVCLAIFLLSFMFGLKTAASAIYVSEISEKSIRSTLLALTPIALSLGGFFTLSIGSFLSWRQIALVVSIFPVAIIVALYFIPETPLWLLSRNRTNDALKSMQWLRGWVSADVVIEEFIQLEKYNAISTATTSCVLCTNPLAQCQHFKEATFYDKIKELTQKRILKPFILVLALNFFIDFNAIFVSQPYAIQVIKAYGIPLDANFTAAIFTLNRVVGTCCFLLIVKKFGKRQLYLVSATVMVLCCIALSIYGFVFFPPNWTSFENPSDPTIPDFDRIRDKVGSCGYFPLASFIIMIFFTAAFGFFTIPVIMIAEVFPLKQRSFLCGLAYTLRYMFAAIASKTYYNIEIWLTLPGASLFYGMITLIGLITMYFILPETEKRSLEDIEAHYANDTKKITDIHIPMSSK